MLLLVALNQLVLIISGKLSDKKHNSKNSLKNYKKIKKIKNKIS